MVENDRLEDSKISVREVLIQAELIKMKQAGKELTLENVLQMLTEKANNTSNPIAEVFKQETEEPLVINFLLSEQEMTFFEGQKYIMAQHLADNLKNRENPKGEFRLLHDANADKDTEIEDIIETIDDYNTDPNNMDEKDKIINNAVLECIKNLDNRYYISNLETIKELCEEILKQPYPEIEQEEWSRKIDINESIEYNYKFLKTISPMLAEQFLNILNQNDDNDKRVSILPFSNEYECEQSMIDGKVFLYYTNTPKDIFTVLHEMIHAMGYSDAINTNSAYRYLRESPTLIIENLFSKWLVKNKIITQNDYNLLKEWRLRDSQDEASKTLMEIALIDMRKKGQYITKKRVLEMIDEKQHINNFVKREECIKYLMKVLINRELYFKGSERYVIGQYISDKVDKSRNPEREFLEIYNLTSNPNITPEKSLKIIKEKYQEQNIDR